MTGRERLFATIGALARKRHQVAERSFARLGLTHTEARILTILNEQGGSATQDALSSQILLDRTNVGRATQRLERDGYLSRTVNEEDKRARLVNMTELGQRTAAEVQSIRTALAEAFLASVSDEQANDIAEVLERALTE